jgi:hypothetical protein
MEKDREIQEILVKYSVDVPYFPMKKNKNGPNRRLAIPCGILSDTRA